MAKAVLNLFILILLLSVFTPSPSFASREERIKWLESNGIKDSGSLIDRYPKIFEFEFSVLQRMWSHLIHQWGATPAYISQTPEILELPFEEVELTAKVLKYRGVQIKDLEWKRRLHLIQTRPAEEAYASIDKVVPPGWRMPREEEKINWLESLGVEDADEVYLSARGAFSESVQVLRSKTDVLKEKLSPIGPIISQFPEILILSNQRYQNLFAWVCDRPMERLAKIREVANWLRAVGVKEPYSLLTKELGLIQSPVVLQEKYDAFKKSGVPDVTAFLTESPGQFLLAPEVLIKPKLNEQKKKKFENPKMSPAEVAVATRWLKGNGIKDVHAVISKKPRILLLNQPMYRDLRNWLSEMGVSDPMKLIGNELDFFLDQSPDEIRARYKEVMTLAVNHRTVSEIQYLKSQGFENINELITQFSDKVMRLGTADYRGLVDWLSDKGIPKPIDFILKHLDFFLVHPLAELKTFPDLLREVSTPEGGGGSRTVSQKCEPLLL